MCEFFSGMVDYVTCSPYGSYNFSKLGMAMGRGGAEGWDLRLRPTWIFLAPSPPRPA